jgi:hypothetical protein
MEDDEDWDNWYYGLIPLCFMIASTYVVYHYFWREGMDLGAPVEKMLEEPASSGEEATKDIVEVKDE